MSIGAGCPKFSTWFDDVGGLEEELQLRKALGQFAPQIGHDAAASACALSLSEIRISPSIGPDGRRVAESAMLMPL